MRYSTSTVTGKDRVFLVALAVSASTVSKYPLAVLATGLPTDTFKYRTTWVESLAKATISGDSVRIWATIRVTNRSHENLWWHALSAQWFADAIAANTTSSGNSLGVVAM